MINGEKLLSCDEDLYWDNNCWMVRMNDIIINDVLWMTSNDDDVSCLGWRVNDEVGYVISRS